ncbi:hypothetical protein STAS_20244 [Striga asiatica]|uniref:Uncharacterized protein n=1 Tax=Striga asiatica TaxID=4170 RepID=A0A5A7QEH4_STRAF|nr:hypothetical protein STAS_20244 [Striga asiatica]
MVENLSLTDQEMSSLTRTAVAGEKPPDRVQTIVRRQPNHHSPPTTSFAQSVAYRYPIHTQIAPPSLRLPRSSPTFPPALRPEPPSITHNHRPHPVLTEDASTPLRRSATAQIAARRTSTIPRHPDPMAKY